MNVEAWHLIDSVLYVNVDRNLRKGNNYVNKDLHCSELEAFDF